MRKRLRKKKRVGEFVELGFAIDGFLRQGADWERFINDAIALAESLGLGVSIAVMDDGEIDGFVTRMGRGSATEADRLAFKDWLSRGGSTVGCEIGPLRDAWNGVHERSPTLARAKTLSFWSRTF